MNKTQTLFIFKYPFTRVLDKESNTPCHKSHLSVIPSRTFTPIAFTTTMGVFSSHLDKYAHIWTNMPTRAIEPNAHTPQRVSFRHVWTNLSYAIHLAANNTTRVYVTAIRVKRIAVPRQPWSPVNKQASTKHTLQQVMKSIQLTYQCTYRIDPTS